MDVFSPDMIAKGLLWYVVFLFSTTMHEAAHALVGKWGGDLTAFRGGQVTLDPRPHIQREPMGMVVFPILSYLFGGSMIGWASAPYDPVWAERHPRRAALMSLAGPSSNLLLVLLSGIAIRVGMGMDIFQAPSSISFSHLTEAPAGGFMGTVAMALSICFMLNLLLGIFNLLPIPPLDGSSVVTLVMSARAARSWSSFMRQPQFAFIGMLIAWRVFPRLFEPFQNLAIALLYPDLTYF